MGELSHRPHYRLPTRGQLDSSKIINPPLHQLGIVFLGGFQILFPLGRNDAVGDLFVDVFPPPDELRMRVVRASDQSFLLGGFGTVEQSLCVSISDMNVAQAEMTTDRMTKDAMRPDLRLESRLRPL
jgi:hypothetical protein